MVNYNVGSFILNSYSNPDRWFLYQVVGEIQSIRTVEVHLIASMKPKHGARLSRSSSSVSMTVDDTFMLTIEPSFKSVNLTQEEAIELVLKCS